MKKRYLLSIIIFSTATLAALAFKFDNFSRENIDLLFADIAITFDSNNAEAYFDRGSIYKNQGKYKQSIADYSKVVSLEPRYEKAYIGRGIVYSKLNKHQIAIDNYHEALQINPDSDLAYYYLGVTYEELNDLQKALFNYTKAIELNPKDFAAYFENRGDLYIDLKEYKKAIYDYNKALKIDPKSTINYIYIAGVYLRLKEYDQAIFNYKKYRQINENIVKFLALNNLGLIQYELNDPQKAIQYWNQALKLKLAGDINIQESRLGIAVVLYKQGKKDEAIELAKKALRKNRKLGDISYLRKQLWGDRLIEDVKELFLEEELQPLIS